MLTQFSPNNIQKYVSLPFFVIGSAYYFNNIENFKPSDYDYIFYKKMPFTRFGDVMPYPGLDAKILYYKEDITKDEFIQFILESANEKHSRIFSLLQKNICDFFGVTYNDIEPYLETIKEDVDIITTKYTKYKYKRKILDYIIENKSFELTDEQIQDVYQIYLEDKRKQFHVYNPSTNQ